MPGVNPAFGSDTAWFTWRKGCVTVKNPDDEILAKMKVIAEALDALVIGDDGEQY